MRFPEMAMIAARQGTNRFAMPVIEAHVSILNMNIKGCVAMIYPGAFNMTTGPLHWELLQRARLVGFNIPGQRVFTSAVCSAVDNQMYVATCSPANDMTAPYHAVSTALLEHLWQKLML